MSSFFPTDVRINLSRDSDVELLGQARRVLFHALHLRAKGAALPITVFDRRPDGTQFSAQITAATKTVSISTPPPPTQEVVPPPPVITESPRRGRAGTMISGWTRGYSVTGSALYSFHPTTNCANAYNIEYGWQPSTKLATTPVQVELVKPSMFSGTMKRVVQAMLGMGIVRDDSPLYFGGAIPAPRQTKVTYGYQWNRTHGIYKAGPQNHWLIEISQVNGIIAMPLPLLANTGTPEFRAKVKSRNDRGTLLVLDEFGALPSGEDFPATGVPLEDAITAGKVLRLMAASGLADYFGDGRMPYYPECGWSISATGHRFRNTNIRIGDPDDRSWLYEKSAPTYGIGRIRASSTMYGEYWGIDIELSEHDVGEPVIGTGSAEIKLLHSGKVDPFYITGMFVPNYAALDKKNSWHDRFTWRHQIGSVENTGSDELWPYQTSQWSPPLRNPTGLAEAEGWGAYVHVQFDGDDEERVKWVIVNTPSPSNLRPGFSSDVLGISTGNHAALFGVDERLFIPKYCRDGFLFSSIYLGAAAYSTHFAGRFSGVGTVSILAMSNLQKQRAHFHQDYWIKGPADHYVKSYGRFDAVINAGPDVQYMMSNGTRGKDAFAASPSNFDFLREGIAAGLENTHPYEFNCVGGHPKGTT